MEATIATLQADVTGFIEMAVGFSVTVGLALVGYTFLRTILRKGRSAAAGRV